MTQETPNSAISLQQFENLVRNKTSNTNWLFLEEFNTELYDELLEVLNLLEKEDIAKGENQVTKSDKKTPSQIIQNSSSTDIKQISEDNFVPPVQESHTNQLLKNIPSEGTLPIDQSKTVDNRFDPLTANNLDSLKFRVKNCIWCHLCDERKSVVFGQGNQRADIIFIGDKPEKEDDSRGVAFWGNSGKLLTQMIQSIGINREAVYVTNIIKCRPPGDRKPLKAETSTCRPILDKQIEILNPKLIVSLGQNSLDTLLNKEINLKQARGKYFKYKEIPLLATYHPNDISKQRKLANDVWVDFRRIRQFLFNLNSNPSKNYPLKQ